MVGNRLEFAYNIRVRKLTFNKAYGEESTHISQSYKVVCDSQLVRRDKGIYEHSCAKHRNLIDITSTESRGKKLCIWVI